VNKHLYLCHPLVLSSPTLMMHGHMNLMDTFHNSFGMQIAYFP